MTATHSYIQRLEQSIPLREPVLRQAIRALRLPPASRGLDLGCGTGRQALILAEAVGPAGHVTGLDLSAEILDYAAQIVEQSGLAHQISLRVGDMTRLPFVDRAFDWVWSADCAGYPVGELLPVLRELVRVVKPGGCVALLAWTSQQLLPGYPLLEARLNATCSGYAPYIVGARPETHFMRALGPYREAGLRDLTARTFAGDVQAPIERRIRVSLASLFEMLWGQRQPGVSAEDWAEYQRLCRPESPDFILDHPDYYAFFTYTLFQGRVRGSAD